MDDKENDDTLKETSPNKNKRISGSLCEELWNEKSLASHLVSPFDEKISSEVQALANKDISAECPKCGSVLGSKNERREHFPFPLFHP